MISTSSLLQVLHDLLLGLLETYQPCIRRCLLFWFFDCCLTFLFILALNLIVLLSIIFNFVLSIWFYLWNLLFLYRISSYVCLCFHKINLLFLPRNALFSCLFLRFKHFLTRPDHTLRDFACRFVSSWRWKIVASYVFDCFLVSVGSWYGRFLFNNHLLFNLRLRSNYHIALYILFSCCHMLH